ncbi:hypothetical protein VCSRO169_3467 [Vibrio cholerae]|nr:hypothetical protein VCSRO169_3467 [Vibrio cholerae]
MTFLSEINKENEKILKLVNGNNIINRIIGL